MSLPQLVSTRNLQMRVTNCVLSVEMWSPKVVARTDHKRPTCFMTAGICSFSCAKTDSRERIRGDESGVAGFRRGGGSYAGDQAYKSRSLQIGTRRVKMDTSRFPQQASMKLRAFDRVRTATHVAGYSLQNNSIGPILSISLKGGPGDDSERAKISGALLPNGRMHIESYKSVSGSLSPSLLSVTPGIFVFIGALAHASDRNCHTVVGLAINDNHLQHRRLVAYLKRYGGRPKYAVDNSAASIPARVLYGGMGTVVEGDISRMLERGMAMLDRQVLDEQA